MTYDKSKIPAYVDAGVAYLDKEHPGWAYLINLAKFDIGMGHTCIIGQLKPKDQWKMMLKQDLGFMGNNDESNAILTVRWREIIWERISA